MEKMKGVLLVALGAASYGILATFVKLAHTQGFGTGEITFSQFFIGFIVLGISSLFPRKRVATGKKPVLQMLLSGTSLGLTSTFYYLAVQYLPVSVCIILLMQTIWMGIVLESIVNRAFPGVKKIIVAIIVLAGTLLATNIFDTTLTLQWPGILYGLASAITYTIAMYSSNKIALEMPAVRRSFLLVSGGMIAILAFWNTSLFTGFHVEVLWRWGLFLALFGTILPPLLFTAGFPKTGIGLGSIISSVEIPVSILCAHIVLQEQVSPLQWLGVAIILAAVVLQRLLDA